MHEIHSKQTMFTVSKNKYKSIVADKLHKIWLMTWEDKIGQSIRARGEKLHMKLKLSINFQYLKSSNTMTMSNPKIKIVHTSSDKES